MAPGGRTLEEMRRSRRRQAGRAGGAAGRHLPRVLLGVGASALLVLALVGVGAGVWGTPADGLASVEVGSSVVAGCEGARGTVTLHREAPAGGLAVDLAATEPVRVTPARVVVAEGQRSAGFDVAASTAEAAAGAEVVATATGDAIRTELSVRPLGVAGVRLASVTAPEGVSVAATAALDCAAGHGGVAVAVTSSDPGLAAPAEQEVVIAEGQREATATLATGPVKARQQTTITATANGVSQTALLTVAPRAYDRPARTGVFDAGRVPEASGVAASRRNPGWLYLVDDQQPREVWAVRPDGSGLQPVPLAGFVGTDTEDLAVAACGPGDPGSCVYVGDIGDNRSTHADVALLRFPEPDLSAPVEPVAPDAVRVRYPDGPMDAEALLVDDDGIPHIVTKEADDDGGSAARLFAAPGFADGVLVDLGPLPVPEPEGPWAAMLLGNLVTGGDYRNGRVLLRTYDAVVEYVAPDPSAPLAEFPTWPAREVPSPRDAQGEAVGFAADGCGYYTVSEMVGDIWFMGCRAAGPEPS